jgi:hypothetical protein
MNIEQLIIFIIFFLLFASNSAQITRPISIKLSMVGLTICCQAIWFAFILRDTSYVWCPATDFGAYYYTSIVMCTFYVL